MRQYFQRAAVIAVVGGGLCLGATQAGLKRSNPPAIGVHLAQPEKVYTPGASIILEVSITNQSNHTLLTCRDLGPASQLCFWELQARDRTGKAMPSLGHVGDSVPGRASSFASTLISNWLALAPHYSYSTAIDVRDVLGADPPPGVYRIRVVLSSDGPTAPSVYNGLNHYPSELKSLPYPGWKGSAESNWVSVKIVARG